MGELSFSLLAERFGFLVCQASLFKEFELLGLGAELVRIATPLTVNVVHHFITIRGRMWRVEGSISIVCSISIRVTTAIIIITKALSKIKTFFYEVLKLFGTAS